MTDTKLNQIEHLFYSDFIPPCEIAKRLDLNVMTVSNYIDKIMDNRRFKKECPKTFKPTITSDDLIPIITHLQELKNYLETEELMQDEREKLENGTEELSVWLDGKMKEYK